MDDATLSLSLSLSLSLFILKGCACTCACTFLIENDVLMNFAIQKFFVVVFVGKLNKYL